MSEAPKGVHVELTPEITIADAQKALLAVAGEFRGQHMDLGCRIKAGGVIVAYAGQLAPHDPPLVGACPETDEGKCALLESAAGKLALKGADAEAIPWTLILSVVVSLLERWLKK